jgi:hypothetical protein
MAPCLEFRFASSRTSDCKEERSFRGCSVARSILGLARSRLGRGDLSTSVIRSKADNKCSGRVFPLLTQNGLSRAACRTCAHPRAYCVWLGCAHNSRCTKTADRRGRNDHHAMLTWGWTLVGIVYFFLIFWPAVRIMHRIGEVGGGACLFWQDQAQSLDYDSWPPRDGRRSNRVAIKKRQPNPMQSYGEPALSTAMQRAQDGFCSCG